MFVFLFVVSCLVFISTITWLSYKLAETRTSRPKLYALAGFVLSFVPPVALVFIAFLAFKEEFGELKYNSSRL
jgi:hypothetical protein